MNQYNKYSAYNRKRSLNCTTIFLLDRSRLKAGAWNISLQFWQYRNSYCSTVVFTILWRDTISRKAYWYDKVPSLHQYTCSGTRTVLIAENVCKLWPCQHLLVVKTLQQSLSHSQDTIFCTLCISRACPMFVHANPSLVVSKCWIISEMISAGGEIWLNLSSIIHVKTSYVNITATFFRSFISFLKKMLNSVLLFKSKISLCFVLYWLPFFRKLNFSRLRWEDEWWKLNLFFEVHIIIVNMYRLALTPTYDYWKV